MQWREMVQMVERINRRASHQQCRGHFRRFSHMQGRPTMGVMGAHIDRAARSEQGLHCWDVVAGNRGHHVSSVRVRRGGCIPGSQLGLLVRMQLSGSRGEQCSHWARSVRVSAD